MNRSDLEIQISSTLWEIGQGFRKWNIVACRLQLAGRAPTISLSDRCQKNTSDDGNRSVKSTRADVRCICRILHIVVPMIPGSSRFELTTRPHRVHAGRFRLSVATKALAMLPVPDNYDTVRKIVCSHHAPKVLREKHVPTTHLIAFVLVGVLIGVLARMHCV